MNFMLTKKNIYGNIPCVDIVVMYDNNFLGLAIFNFPL
jgi:hypothetical protein